MHEWQGPLAQQLMMAPQGGFQGGVSTGEKAARTADLNG